METIYVIEDHEIIRKGIGAYLENSGYSAVLFSNLTSAKKAISEKEPDLIIQDIMLPDGDGAEFIKELRKTSNVPVIFMTAKVAEADRIHGFEIGADDYITKPFSPKELVLRVQAVLKRAKSGFIPKPEAAEVKGNFSCNGKTIEIDEKQHIIRLEGKDLPLTAAEWRVLIYLIKNQDRISSRDDILSDCFDYAGASYDRIADTHIKNLRAKLGSLDWIETVRGFGYRFAGVKEN